MNLLKKIIYTLLLTISTTGIAFSNDIIRQTEYFPDIAISQVEGTNSLGGKELKILISSKRKVTPQEIFKAASPKTYSEEFALDKTLWTITHNLPITDMQCIEEEMDECDEEKNKEYSNACYQPCITYGPRPLAYDEKNKKIYFYASSTMGGTGGNLYFIFSGDTKTQKIEYLASHFGPVKATLSPDGKYIVLSVRNHLTVFEIANKKKIYIDAENERENGKQILHGLFNVKWLNNTTFSYNEGTRHSKFQSSHDTMKEMVYDVAENKIIKSREMSLEEFDHTPYNDD